MPHLRCDCADEGASLFWLKQVKIAAKPFLLIHQHAQTAALESQDMRPRSLHVSWTKVSLAMLGTQVVMDWGQFQSLGAIWKEYLLRHLYSLCHSAATLVAP